MHHASRAGVLAVGVICSAGSCVPVEHNGDTDLVPEMLAAPPSGRWHLDEGSGTVVLDSSGAGHHGTISGAEYAVGRSDFALAFDGVADHVVLPIDISETPFTIALWFKTADANGTLFAAVDPVSPTAGAWDRQLGTQDGKLCHRVWSDETYCSAANVDDDAWHHAAATVGAGGGHLYVDGVLVASGTKTGSDFDWQTGVVLGYHHAWGGISGVIDGVEIYDHAATPAEVATLYHQAAATDGGTGLTGEYFDNADFTALRLTRHDATVDFDWGEGSPDVSVRPDTFSVRWTGKLQPRYSQPYTFYTTSDDGVRLWVDNTLVIDNWTDHEPTEDTGTITLTANATYELRLEYFENGGGAQAKLQWASASQPKQIIPRGRLYPARPAADSPLDQRQRIATYAWGFDETAYPGTPDRLTWAAQKVSALGNRTIRIALATSNPYQVNPSGTPTLAQIAGSPAYDALFTNSAFDTYFLTTYSASDMASVWADGYQPQEQLAARTEIIELGRYLLSHYGNKSFVIINWEGDNALSPFADSQIAWDGYVDWINTRAVGVEQARRREPTTTSRLYSALEYNLVRGLATGQACDGGADKCVISYVAPRALVDLYSYSSYQSLNDGGADIKLQLPADLSRSLAYVQPSRPSFGPAQFVIGEFGFAREFEGECTIVARSADTISGLEAWGASYGVVWQLIDNPPASGSWLGFGLYDLDAQLTLLGQQFQILFQTQAIVIPASTCPAIAMDGVVNGATWTQVFHPGDTIAIFGSAFSSSGNVVHVRQGATTYDVSIGSPWWYESPGQINATLPADVVAGDYILIWVTDTNGIESNSGFIGLVP